MRSHRLRGRVPNAGLWLVLSPVPPVVAAAVGVALSGLSGLRHGGLWLDPIPGRERSDG